MFTPKIKKRPMAAFDYRFVDSIREFCSSYALLCVGKLFCMLNLYNAFYCIGSTLSFSFFPLSFAFGLKGSEVGFIHFML